MRSWIEFWTLLNLQSNFDPKKKHTHTHTHTKHFYDYFWLLYISDRGYNFIRVHCRLANQCYIISKPPLYLYPNTCHIGFPFLVHAAKVLVSENLGHFEKLCFLFLPMFILFSPANKLFLIILNSLRCWIMKLPFREIGLENELKWTTLFTLL